MWNNATITDVGRTMIARCINGEQLKFARARLGAGTVPAVNLNKQTDVTDFADSAVIGEVKRVTDGVSCVVRITRSSQFTFTCKQIGIFGRLLGESQDSLIAIYQDETGIVIPGDMPEFLYKFNAVIAIDNTENVTVTVESGIYTTRDEVDAIVKAESTMLSGTDSKYNPFGAVYEAGDMVIYNNEIWQALQMSRFVTPEEGAYWTKVSLKALQTKLNAAETKLDSAYVRSTYALGAPAWNNTTDYAPMSHVVWNNKPWVALDANKNSEPSESNTKWKLMTITTLSGWRATNCTNLLNYVDATNVTLKKIGPVVIAGGSITIKNTLSANTYFGGIPSGYKPTTWNGSFRALAHDPTTQKAYGFYINSSGICLANNNITASSTNNVTLIINAMWFCME